MPLWQERLLMLNRRQARALFFGVMAFIFMGLFPPWEYTYMNPAGKWYDRDAGFYSVLMPPEVKNDTTFMYATVNWTQLFIQWAVAGGLTLAFLWGLKDRLPHELPAPPRGTGQKTHH